MPFSFLTKFSQLMLTFGILYYNCSENRSTSITLFQTFHCYIRILNQMFRFIKSYHLMITLIDVIELIDINLDYETDTISRIFPFVNYV